MIKSESIAKLAGALAKCQGEIKGAKRDSDNPFFKSTYADLESCWEACRSQLSENELAVIQTSDETDKGVIVETLLTHSSGEFVGGRMFIPLTKIDAQTVGSATTYARRYSLMAIVGLAPTDDDGNAATAGVQGVKPKNEEKPQEDQSSVVDEEYRTQIKEKLHALYGDDNEAKKEKLMSLTVYTPKGTTETKQGRYDYHKMTGDPLKYLAGKVAKLTQEREPGAEG